MSVLVTALGSMAAPFVVESLRSQGYAVVGVDIHPREWIAASAQVDVFSQVPSLQDAVAYEQALLSLCRAHDVRHVLPLTDPEVDWLSGRSGVFEDQGVRLALPRQEAVRLMRDKLALHECFRDSFVPVIPTCRREDYLQDCGVFPCLAKPARGRSSEGHHSLETPAAFAKADTLGGHYIFQPYLVGDVVVVDFLRSASGQLAWVARRELLRTKNGAGIAVQILEPNDVLQRYLEVLGKVLDLHGCVNVEFLQLLDGSYRLMDVNPRFSAGVAFSGMAGYDFVRALLRLQEGEAVEPPTSIAQGAIYTRKYVEVIA